MLIEKEARTDDAVPAMAELVDVGRGVRHQLLALLQLPQLIVQRREVQLSRAAGGRFQRKQQQVHQRQKVQPALLVLQLQVRPLETKQQQKNSIDET